MPRRTTTKQVIVSVTQQYAPDLKLFAIMDTFRMMLNDCIRIGLAENKTSLESIQKYAYPELKKYAIASAYRNNAMSRACGILSSFRKLVKKGRQVKRPYCSKAMITTCRGFTLRLEGNQLVLPQKIRVNLNDYVIGKLRGKEIRSVTISMKSVSISYALQGKQASRESVGVLGADFNYENITASDSTSDVLRNIRQYPMDQVLEYKLQCRETKRHFTRNDARIRQKIYEKYGKLEADKTISVIHKITSRIVKRAKKHHLTIAVEEEIKDIRKLGNRGNWHGRNARFKLNSWARGEAKRQLEYKCEREGVQLFTVSARGTSSKCAVCGDKMITEEHRSMHCPTCRMHIDRDDNASVNIMKGGLQKLFWTWFRPGGLSGEAMKGNPKKLERKAEVIPGVEDSQVVTVLTKR